MQINEFSQRRHQLMELMEPNSIAVLTAAPERIRNRDCEYAYRQDSDFQYLTGFPEPEAVAVLMPGRPQGEYLLFCRDKDRSKEIWTGFRAGPEGARQDYDADDAFPIGNIDDILPGLIEGRERVYHDLGKNQGFDQQLMGWLNQIRAQSRSGAQPLGEFIALGHTLHELRLFKSAAEIKIMTKASEISAQAHCRAMQQCRPGWYEYQLEAELLYDFMRQGARAPAYNTIVGSGANGCVLHYVENSSKMKSGDLVLIDAGCELECYAADITRTFPVNGKYSKPQQALYELVLASQYAAIDQVKPGNHWNQPHQAAVQVLTQGLLDLGLLEGSVDELIEQQSYNRFYMHRTGHWLGMDVHDVGEYKVGDKWRSLEPGMAMTVEPGLYVAPDDMSVDEQWRGIGIRIEDDVVVTRSGCTVLTDGVPKQVKEVEQLMAANE